MKRIYTALIICVFAFYSEYGFAQESAKDIKIVNSKISGVTLFVDGAEIIRETSVEITKGVTTLSFQGLSRSIIRNSVQFSSDKNLTILSVTQRSNFLVKSDKSLELEKLEKRLSELNGRITDESTNLSVILEDMEFLRANRSIAGHSSALTVAAVQQMSDYYSNRFSALKIKEIAKSKIIKELTESRDSLTREIEHMRRDNTLPSGEILVKVSSANTGIYNLRLTYATSGASWKPLYDIRAASLDRPLILSYKGEVVQRTGENWSNVVLRLSSGSPSVSGILPKLEPQYLRYPQIVAIRGAKSIQRDMNLAYSTMEVPESAEAPAIISERQTSVEFTTANRYTINSDGESHIVDLTTYEMPAEYKYFAIPKIEKDVYLMASVAEREKYNLLNGEANIYFEGRFTGTTFIDAENTSDTLNFSLGRDRGVAVSREQITDYTEHKFIGSKKEELNGWRTVIRNNKNQHINIIVADQIPVSTIDEIEVSVQNLSGGVLARETGEVKWEISLEPSASKQIDLQYIIKYPKNKTIVK